MNIQIEVNHSTYERLEKAAGSVGLTVEELCHVVLGAQAASPGLYIPFSLPLAPFSSSPPREPNNPPSVNLGTEVDAITARMVTTLLRAAAVMGGVNCPQCSQKISQDDVTSNICPKCGSAIV